MGMIEEYTSVLTGYLNWLWNDQILVSSHSLFGNYFWGIAILSLLFFGLEILSPWRKNQKLFRKDFWLDAFYMYFNIFIFYIIIFAVAQQIGEDSLLYVLSKLGIENTTIFDVSEWPEVLQILVVFVVTDFTHWNIHRMLHKYKWLWRFHKLHHSIKEMGFAAHLRFHWMESILYKSITYVPFLFIGFDVENIFILHMITIGWGHFNHANFSIPLGPLKYVFNTPDMHIWHHAKELPKDHQMGVNFGLTLSVWDYIFKTNYIPNSGRDIELGFEGDDQYPDDFFGQVTSGFKKD